MKFPKTIITMIVLSVGLIIAGTLIVSANGQTKHTVKSGETVSELAEKYDVSENKFKKVNKSKNIDKIFEGEVFIFDGKGNVKVDKKSVKNAPKSALVSKADASVKSNDSAKATTAKATTDDNNDSKSNQTTVADDQATDTAKAQATDDSDDQAATPAVQAAPVAAAPVAATPAPQPAPAAPAQSSAVVSDGSLDSIGAVESGNDYNATNGQYIGKYQLSASYLNGDHSPANQERVARDYAVSRYGSVENAVAFRNANNYW
ncbi:LysM domain-containing protein [Fructilactobacillus vespulae]|uniref:LysM peptidoglycan-binding domain-containing protein n=1 Tax=Fructilactobacillus vespulae TaxID=1249630 RepID=UPI0039B63066